MKKIVAPIATMALLLSAGSVTAFAAESYGYLAGQARNEARLAAYIQAEGLAIDEEAQVYIWRPKASAIRHIPRKQPLPSAS